MEKYRHTATGVLVEAAQLTSENVDEVAMWCGGNIVREVDPFTREESKGLNIPTPEGTQRISEGQYVMRHAGSFHKVMPHRFRLTYIPIQVQEGLVPKDVRDSMILRDRTDET